jgi:hypothetical protein
MTQDFSDAPLRVNGITIQPKSPWSAQYRAHVADNMCLVGRRDLSPEEIEERYIIWYAGKNGLTLNQARQRVKAMR